MNARHAIIFVAFMSCCFAGTALAETPSLKMLQEDYAVDKTGHFLYTHKWDEEKTYATIETFALSDSIVHLPLTLKKKEFVFVRYTADKIGFLLRKTDDKFKNTDIFMFTTQSKLGNIQEERIGGVFYNQIDLGTNFLTASPDNNLGYRFRMKNNQNIQNIQSTVLNTTYPFNFNSVLAFTEREDIKFLFEKKTIEDGGGLTADYAAEETNSSNLRIPFVAKYMTLTNETFILLGDKFYFVTPNVDDHSIIACKSSNYHPTLRAEDFCNRFTLGSPHSDSNHDVLSFPLISNSNAKAIDLKVNHSNDKSFPIFIHKLNNNNEVIFPNSAFVLYDTEFLEPAPASAVVSEGTAAGDVSPSVQSLGTSQSYKQYFIGTFPAEKNFFARLTKRVTASNDKNLCEIECLRGKFNIKCTDESKRNPITQVGSAEMINFDSAHAKKHNLRLYCVANTNPGRIDNVVHPTDKNGQVLIMHQFETNEVQKSDQPVSTCIFNLADAVNLIVTMPTEGSGFCTGQLASVPLDEAVVTD